MSVGWGVAVRERAWERSLMLCLGGSDLDHMPTESFLALRDPLETERERAMRDDQSTQHPSLYTTTTTTTTTHVCSAATRPS
jgi:hypothetical protein